MDSRRTTRHRSLLSAALFLLCALYTSVVTAQSLDSFNLLGGKSTPLVPSESVEPKLTVTLTPESASGDETRLTLSVRVETAANAYTYSQNPSFGGATEIAVTEVYGLEAVDDAFTPDHPPKVVFESAFGHDVEKFPGGVTWRRRYRLIGNVPADQVTLGGTVDFQVCDDRNCRPLRESFEAFVELPADGSPDSAGPTVETPPLASDSSDSSDAATGEGERATVAPVEINTPSRSSEGSLPWYLCMAFLGGLVLNVMPCVLPVLAIKVMSFVQQAGESRGRILALNVSYSLGVIGVFLALASLAIFPQILGARMGWGGLFQLDEFNLVMIALVFAMGLSLLGVFEIPIPGMIGAAGGKHREGLAGAFIIGTFATLLATPCSGPFMGPALAWSVRQEPHLVYLVWGLMGLGMASPFLIVGFVPSLARFIPRPGDWMVRFKEFCGFTLLGTVIWLMNPLDSEVILPTLIMLLGLGLGLWMIGSLYDHSSSPGRKMTVRFYALLSTGLICWFGFTKYQEGELLAEADQNDSHIAVEGDLPWEPFSGARLQELLQEGKPVLIDFTADWCLVCKQNEKFALNTEPTNEFVRQNQVVTLYADFTDKDAEIRRWLEKFGSISVPLTVIFPEGDPQNYHVLDGPYSQATLLGLLEESVSEKLPRDDQQSARLEHALR